MADGEGEQAFDLRGYDQICEVLGGIADTTARDWEREHGLPLYRLNGGKYVYARKQELVSWMVVNFRK